MAPRRSSAATPFLLATVFALLLLPSFSHAVILTVEGKVTRVSDGDSIIVETAEETKLRTRLYGIDAPEVRQGKKIGQPFGEDAKRALSGMILGKKVRLEIIDVDRYRRMVGIVYLDGKNVNEEMVRLGLAWAYRRYLDAPYASEFIGAEEEAREKGLGLWQEPNPVPPWEFRRRTRR
jgi:micrococcal nuclease